MNHEIRWNQRFFTRVSVPAVVVVIVYVKTVGTFRFTYKFKT